MSDTPRTDYALIAVDFVRGAPVPYVTADFARQLERELARLTEDFSVLNRENTKAQRELAEAKEVCRAAKAVSENTWDSDCPTSLLVQLQEAFDKWDATCAG